MAGHGRAWQGMAGHDMASQGMQGVAHMAGSDHLYESSFGKTWNFRVLVELPVEELVQLRQHSLPSLASYFSFCRTERNWIVVQLN